MPPAPEQQADAGGIGRVLEVVSDTEQVVGCANPGRQLGNIARQQVNAGQIG